MPVVRKLVRDAVRHLLADPVSGFNAHLSGIATAYGVMPFAIDWDIGSDNFFQGFLLPDQIEISQLLAFPGAVLYTSTAQNQTEGAEKFRRFSGEVTANLDFYFNYEEGAEVNDTESLCDAVEDAVTHILNDPAVAWPPGVIWDGKLSLPRESLTLTGDGYEQRIPIVMTFEVHV